MESFDKHIDLLTTELLKSDYFTDERSIRISLYMPTHRKGAEIQQGPIRLKRLINEAHQKVVDHGIRSSEAWNILAPAQKLLDDTFFWSNQGDGLVLFITPEEMSMFRLPLQFEENVNVNHRFYIKPLIPLFSEDGRFYILALSQGGVRLLQGSHYTIGEIDLKETPTNLNEVLKQFDFERTLQAHTGVSGLGTGGERQSMMFHGHGAGGDESNMKEKLFLFMRRLDSGLRKTLGQESAPMVLAGVDFVRGYYREANHYPNLLQEGIEGNPDRWTPEELHHKAWGLVKPSFAEQTEKAMQRYRDLSGTSNGEKTTGDLKQAVLDAYFQRVETLFVPQDSQCWGKFDPENAEVLIGEKEESGSEELFDFATFYTIKNNGTVFLVPEENIPSGSNIAAIYW